VDIGIALPGCYDASFCPPNSGNSTAGLTPLSPYLGSRSLTAVYSGDGKFFGSISPVQTQMVVPAPTSVPDRRPARVCSGGRGAESVARGSAQRGLRPADGGACAARVDGRERTAAGGAWGRIAGRGEGTRWSLARGDRWRRGSICCGSRRVQTFASRGWWCSS